MVATSVNPTRKCVCVVPRWPYQSSSSSSWDPVQIKLFAFQFNSSFNCVSINRLSDVGRIMCARAASVYPTTGSYYTTVAELDFRSIKYLFIHSFFYLFILCFFPFSRSLVFVCLFFFLPFSAIAILC